MPAGGAIESSRRCLILDLRQDPDLIARYEAWHRPGAPPAAVTRSLRDAGIAELEIFRSGDRLVMIMDVEPCFDLRRMAAAAAADPDVQRWEALMDQFQKPVTWAATGEKWVAAKSIYRLSDQPPTSRAEQE